MKVTLKGDNLPYAVVDLEKGETVYSETGGMAWMTPGIEMDTNMRGGIGKAIGRAFSGESLFLVHYTAEEDNQSLVFSSEFPGHIKEFDIKGGELIVQKDAFMFAQDSVDLSVHFTKRLGMGFFGGEGFILQKLSGEGKAYIEVAGSVEEKELAEGEELVVDTGYVAAYESSVDADIKMMKGFKNVLFGGEGLFVARLKGPGKVWLQSMPIIELAKKVIRYIPKK